MSAAKFSELVARRDALMGLVADLHRNGASRNDTAKHRNAIALLNRKIVAAFR